MSLSINFNYNYPQVAREAGFKLRQYKDGPLDWRLLGALDLERIQRDQYFEQVDGVLAHIAEVPLANMLETNILDSGIAKYFMLSQYAVQYLLFCRKFLDETVADLREAYAASQVEVARLKKAHMESNNEILQLHKKITQMEAIHEVVYPCHMCSKCFISNEALNIHISRKHQAAKLASDGGRMSASTPVGGGGAGSGQQQQQRQDKVDDLHLINTIKLELEIKQLKERLNVAEREIRERSAANSKRPTPRDQQQPQQQQLGNVTPPSKTLVKSVGIQSNLMEMKEQDETSLISNTSAVANDEPAMKMVRPEQLSQLQDKVREFDEWRESLRSHNDASIAEINKKLSELTQTLADSVRVKQAGAASVATDRRPSVSNLEQIVMEKVTEIGRASAEKLEQVVYHMELNYKEKLDELEREIKRKNVEQTPKSSTAPVKPTKFLQRSQTMAEAEPHTDSDDEQRGDGGTDIKASIVKVQRYVDATNITGKTKEPKLSKDRKSNDETFVIEELPTTSKSTQPPVQKQKSSMLVLGSVSTEDSNQTFVKAVLPQHVKSASEQTKAPKDTHETSESTDVSESLDDESYQSTSASLIVDRVAHEVEDLVKHPVVKVAADRPKTAKATRSESPKRAEKLAINKSKQQAKPKPFRRKDAKTLTQRKLQHLGIDSTAIRTISNSALKKSNAGLHEERNKLKQKYPNFYATRNKMKKLVDKLCSTKLPESAEALLVAREPLQPLERQHFVSARDDSFEIQEPKSSTPKNDQSTEKDIFKQRLENILTSPMRRPSNVNAAPKEMEKIIEIQSKPTMPLPVPVPVPRKRVMFNTSSAIQSNEPNRFAF